MIIHFNLHASEEFPIKLYGKEDKIEDIKIKITNGLYPVVVKTLSTKLFLSEEQQEFGHSFYPDQFITYGINIKKMEDMCASVQIFKEKECIGVTYISQKYFTNSRGSFISILLNPGTSEISAEIKFDYAILKDWENEKSQTKSYSSPSVPQEFLFMGHRGSGETADRSSDVLENTIPSFRKAHSHGVSYVELDIMMTKDLVPVVFHDYYASLFTEKRDGTRDPTSAAVKDLTLEEVKNCVMDFARINAGSNYDEKFCSLFPTLQEVLDKTPESLGLFIEVKYPYQEKESKVWEIENYVDENLLVDRILDVLMNYHGNRLIKICSFDPEVCLMFRRKQNRFPVYIITTGENTDWEAYMDIRSRTVSIAMNFVIMNDLMGISFYANPLINDKEELTRIISTMKSHGKHCITWGSANDSKDNIAMQRSLGLTGIISDRANELVTSVVDSKS